MAGLFRKIDCIRLPVDDLDKAIGFYQDRLDHELIWRSATAAGFRLPESDAELVVHTEEQPPETDLLVASVPEAIEEFVRAGGSVMISPFRIPIGLCAIVRDPWGNALTILDASHGLLEVDAHKNVRT